MIVTYQPHVFLEPDGICAFCPESRANESTWWCWNNTVAADLGDIA